ncbi:MAG: hypothetical protein U0414_39585 [Polyangiaceae bacterium]
MAAGGVGGSSGSASGPSGSPGRTGRRVAIFLLFAFLAAFVGGVTLQLTLQVFFKPIPDAKAFPTCRVGTKALYAAVERAVTEAQGEPDVPKALALFRSALAPDWDHIELVRKLCAAPEAATDRASLDAVERLRYAEEHAVRREAASLEHLRKQVERDLGAPSPGRTPPPPPSSGAPDSTD